MIFKKAKHAHDNETEERGANQHLAFRQSVADRPVEGREKDGRHRENGGDEIPGAILLRLPLRCIIETHKEPQRVVRCHARGLREPQADELPAG